MLLKEILSYKMITFAVIPLLSIGITPKTLAANLDLQEWEKFGDVLIENTGQKAKLSTDATFFFGFGDDSDVGAHDGEFNQSGQLAEFIGFEGLEEDLGIPVESLDVEGFAYEGSAIKTELTVNRGDILSFEWQFFSNETSTEIEDELRPFKDYAFVLIDDKIMKLADYQKVVEQGLLEVETGIFDSKTQKEIWEYRFEAEGTYQVALGIIDIDDFLITSALSVENVKLQIVPEPLTILGTLTAIGFGCGFKKSLKKGSKNDDHG